MIFGARKISAGNIKLKGKPLEIRSPRDAIDCGIGFLTENRKEQGLFWNDGARQHRDDHHRNGIASTAS